MKTPVASVGEARLMKHLGKTGAHYVLAGGSEVERVVLEKWIFMFMKGATIERTS